MRIKFVVTASMPFSAARFLGIRTIIVVADVVVVFVSVGQNLAC